MMVITGNNYITPANGALTAFVAHFFYAVGHKGISAADEAGMLIG
ncbi:hypothetical protein HNQ91_001074 [Filimonas zeae]|nr:hypothetical protein [Filimonas zeae]MDR6338052.1 hypothetical protein [Filimonas zeae]